MIPKPESPERVALRELMEDMKAVKNFFLGTMECRDLPVHWVAQAKAVHRRISDVLARTEAMLKGREK